MSILQDLNNGTVRDWQTIFKIAFAYQNGKLNDIELLSFGAIGKYWYTVFNGDGYVYRNGEKTTKQVQFAMVELSEQEEFLGQLTGTLTGRKIETTSKKAIKADSTSMALDMLDTYLESVKNCNGPKTLGFWIKQHVIRQAFDLKLFNEKYYNYVAESSAEVKRHVGLNWKVMSPSQLRTDWEALQALKVEPKQQVNGNQPKTKKQILAELDALKADGHVTVDYSKRDTNEKLEDILNNGITAKVSANIATK